VSSRDRRVNPRYVLVVVLSLLIGAAFAALSATVNGQPSTEPFDGWAAVLEQDGVGVFGDDREVLLSAEVSQPTVEDERPQLTYSVVACGSRPFQGMLVLGGNARVTDARPSPPNRLEIVEVSDFAIQDPVTGSDIELGDVQVLEIDLRDLPACLPRSSLAEDDMSFAGVAEGVVGFAQAPIERTWQLGWWAGPRTTQTWPLVGTFPGVPVSVRGVFEGARGLTGSWTIPTERFQVSGGGVSPSSDIDVARPDLESDTHLSWTSLVPFSPTARLTDVEAMSAWQQGLVAATIALGIGGSLLASVFFDLVRGTSPQRASTTRLASLGPDGSGLAPSPARRSRANIGVVVLVSALTACLWRRSRRR
jgi:hypothetical protein